MNPFYYYIQLQLMGVVLCSVLLWFNHRHSAPDTVKAIYKFTSVGFAVNAVLIYAGGVQLQIMYKDTVAAAVTGIVAYNWLCYTMRRFNIKLSRFRLVYAVPVIAVTALVYRGFSDLCLLLYTVYAVTPFVALVIGRKKLQRSHFKENLCVSACALPAIIGGCADLWLRSDMDSSFVYWGIVFGMLILYINFQYKKILFDNLTGIRNRYGLDEEIEELIAQRTQARKDKNWALADQIRDDLKARGIVLEDTPDGVKWKVEK